MEVYVVLMFGIADMIEIDDQLEGVFSTKELADKSVQALFDDLVKNDPDTKYSMEKDGDYYTIADTERSEYVCFGLFVNKTTLK